MRASSLKFLPLVLCLLGFYSHQCYIESSRGQGVGFVEVPGASLNRTFSELARLERESKAPVWISETPNIVLAKFQAAYARSRRLLFLAKDYFRVKGMQRPFLEKQHFDLRNGETNPFLLDRRVRTALESGADTLVLASAVSQGVLNHRTESAVSYRTVVPMTLEGIVNRLAFIESERGQTYSVKNRLLTSIYPAEDDLFFRGSKSNAVGRHLLFQVLNPSRPFRVVLGFTTVNKRGELRRIPPVAAVGSERVPFAVAGYGSARVVSPPLSPQVIAGLPFIAVDLGVDGSSASEPRTRAMALYGADLPLDYRRTVGIAREISLISEEQYKAFTPPSTLHSFPKDLRHPDIEYSGIYEDGWVADSAFVRLASPADLRPFVMEGEIPSFETGFRTTLQVTIDGEHGGEMTLESGHFRFQSEPLREGIHHIDLRFSRVHKLAGSDDRRVSGRITRIGFPASAEAPDIFGTGLSAGRNWYEVESYGKARFRWVDTQAEVILSNPAIRSLRAEVEPGPGINGRPFDLTLLDGGGKPLHRARVERRQAVVFPVPKNGSQRHRILLKASERGHPLALDPRILTFRAFRIEATQNDAPERQSDEVFGSALVRPGRGWYPVEHYGGSTFRWGGNEPEIVLTGSRPQAIIFDLEAREKPFVLHVLDTAGRRHQTIVTNGRTKVTVLPPCPPAGACAFTLRSARPAQPTAGDPRTLNFRVFSVTAIPANTTPLTVAGGYPKPRS